MRPNNKHNNNKERKTTSIYNLVLFQVNICSKITSQTYIFEMLILQENFVKPLKYAQVEKKTYSTNISI